MPETPLAEAQTAEALHAAAVAAEAKEKARAAQSSEVEERIVNRLSEHLGDIINEVFTVPDEPGKQRKFIDITRIPAICNDVADIKSDLKWIKYIGGGFVAAAGILALKSLGV